MDARYRVGVFLIVYFLHISWIQTYLLRPCSVSAWRMKVVTREYVSSFLRTGLFFVWKDSCLKQTESAPETIKSVIKGVGNGSL